MLSYRHSFHAGNHADVLKHIVQSLIIGSLKHKDKPFVYHDTHSGAGRYDLFNQHAEKTGEYKDGIARLWLRDDLPAELIPYFSTIKMLNSDSQFRFYPGSPKIASLLLREQDRCVLSELHTTDFSLLLQEFRGNRQIKIHNEDGFSHLKASLPPKERRGLVLIDPSYELKHEYQDVVNAIRESVKRWATGIYAIWYPVVYRENVDLITEGIKSIGIRNILQIELGIKPDTKERGMTASGMIVINPPWQLENQMKTILPWLESVLAPDTGHSFVRWL